MSTPESTQELFAWAEGWPASGGPGEPGALGSVEALERKRVTQCALSRICGSCGAPLGRPIAFVGIPQEVERNAFYAPPLHQDCAAALVAMSGAEPSWRVVTTSGFEYVRPGRDDLERYPTFQPNSVV